MTEASNEDLAMNRTSVDKSKSMIALYPEKPMRGTHIWNYLNLDTMMPIKRNYGSTVPYSQAQIDKMNKEAVTPGSKNILSVGIRCTTEERKKNGAGGPLRNTLRNPRYPTPPLYYTKECPPHPTYSQQPQHHLL